MDNELHSIFTDSGTELSRKVGMVKKVINSDNCRENCMDRDRGCYGCVRAVLQELKSILSGLEYSETSYGGLVRFSKLYPYIECMDEIGKLGAIILRAKEVAGDLISKFSPEQPVLSADDDDTMNT